MVVARNSLPLSGLDMATSLSRESSSSLPSDSAESSNEGFAIGFLRSTGAMAFDDALAATMPLEAVVRTCQAGSTSGPMSLARSVSLERDG